ncbi:hypothetical protein TNCV_3622921 [Trichonephila clavipes]|nr:hypothetical protein TNCV_3622921 [Trichonephila clavipes]
MELPLASPRQLRYKSAKEIHENHKKMSSGMVADGSGTLKMAEQTSTTKPVFRRNKKVVGKLEDRRTTRELCEKVPEVSKTTIDKILTEHLGYSKVCARWVPKCSLQTTMVEAAQESRFHGTKHFGLYCFRPGLHHTGNKGAIEAVETPFVKNSNKLSAGENHN